MRDWNTNLNNKKNYFKKHILKKTVFDGFFQDQFFLNLKKQCFFFCLSFISLCSYVAQKNHKFISYVLYLYINKTVAINLLAFMLSL